MFFLKCTKQKQKILPEFPLLNETSCLLNIYCIYLITENKTQNETYSGIEANNLVYSNV